MNEKIEIIRDMLSQSLENNDWDLVEEVLDILNSDYYIGNNDIELGLNEEF